jgi:hypothetical protein
MKTFVNLTAKIDALITIRAHASPAYSILLKFDLIDVKLRIVIRILNPINI